MRRAQAAMEYLITYGWAILIMLVVVGVLFYLGIFTPRGVSGCSFQTAGFTCYAYKLASNSSGESGIILDMGQATGHDIKIIGFNCTTSESWMLIDFAAGTWQNVTISSGSHKTLNGTLTKPSPLPCYKADGSLLKASDVGSYYKGKIYIHYLDVETNLDHKAIGDISGNVE